MSIAPRYLFLMTSAISIAGLSQDMSAFYSISDTSARTTIQVKVKNKKTSTWAEAKERAAEKTGKNPGFMVFYCAGKELKNLDKIGNANLESVTHLVKRNAGDFTGLPAEYAEVGPILPPDFFKKHNMLISPPIDAPALNETGARDRSEEQKVLASSKSEEPMECVKDLNAKASVNGQESQKRDAKDQNVPDDSSRQNNQDPRIHRINLARSNKLLATLRPWNEIVAIKDDREFMTAARGAVKAITESFHYSLPKDPMIERIKLLYDKGYNFFDGTEQLTPPDRK